MKTSLPLQLAALAAAVLSALTPFKSAVASQFEQQEVIQEDFIAIAAPVGQTTKYQLLILEQLSADRLCWTESGFNPIVVDPLLLQFDFTGICGRSTDSNGYSMRMGGQDWGLNYDLRIVQRDRDLVLVGVPIRGEGSSVELGRTNGITSGFVKIALNPGWRFTKRTYQGQTLGHVYLTHDLTLSEVLGTGTSPAAYR
jgi:N-acetylmuramoyl-L-alanine amidase